MSEVKREYITSEEQLRRWVEGESVHRLWEVKDNRYDEGGECCPDFSCCKPEMLAEKSVRQAFAAASQDERLGFLGNFLGELIAREYGDKKEIKIVTGREQE